MAKSDSMNNININITQILHPAMCQDNLKVLERWIQFQLASFYVKNKIASQIREMNQFAYGGRNSFMHDFIIASVS